MFLNNKKQETEKVRDAVVLIHPDLHSVLGIIAYLGKRSLKDVVMEAVTSYYELDAKKIKQLLDMNNQFKKEKKL